MHIGHGWDLNENTKLANLNLSKFNCFIFKRCKGEVIAALAEKLLYLGSVVVLEALVARRAVRFAVELGLSSSIIEGDSEGVYRALQNSDWHHSSIGEIVKDIVSIAGSSRTFSFSHTKR